MANLPELTEGLREYNDRAEARAAEIKKGNLPDALRAYHMLRTHYEALDEERKRTFRIMEGLARNAIPEMMTEQDVKTVSLEDIQRRFTKLMQVSTSIIDKDRGYQWLRENQAGDLIQPTVNSSSLSAWVRSFVAKKGREPPADLFKISTSFTISSTKA